MVSEIKTKHFWLYVLKLEQEKYYIGITSKTPEDRFQEHQNGFMAAKWTKKYKPIKIIDTIDLGEMTLEQAEAFENKVVRRYMKEKGYNNARGGDLTNENNYKQLFDYLLEWRDWEAMKVILVLLFCMLFILVTFMIDKYSS